MSVHQVAKPPNERMGPDQLVVDSNLKIFLRDVHPDKSNSYLFRVEEKLAKVGVKNLTSLISLLHAPSSGQTLNSMLKAAGEKCFTTDTLHDMREVILREYCAVVPYQASVNRNLKADVDRNLKDFLFAVHPDRSRSYLLRVEEKLSKAGIRSLRDLFPMLLVPNKGQTLNSRMKAVGEKCFRADTLFLMREGLLCQGMAVKEFLHWAAPYWQEDIEALAEKLWTVDVHDVRSLNSLLIADNLLNEKLKLCGSRCLSNDLLRTLQQRAIRVAAFDQRFLELSVHLMSGKLVAVLSARDCMTGTSLKREITHHLEPGVAIEVILCDGVQIQESRTLRQLGIKNGAVLTVLLCKHFNDDDSDSHLSDFTGSDG